MDLISPPKGWVEIPESELEEYLKTCPDYRRDSYANTASYFYAHNKKSFAVLHSGKCFIDPVLLTQP